MDKDINTQKNKYKKPTSNRIENEFRKNIDIESKNIFFHPQNFSFNHAEQNVGFTCGA